MLNKKFFTFATVLVAVFAVFSFFTPVKAEARGGGPWGDIDGYYTWQINGKGWTVYSQNGYSWVYDDYGNRTYLDAYGNKLDGVTAAAAATISQYKLTYYGYQNGMLVYQNPDGKLYSVSSDGRLTYISGGGAAPTPAKSGDLVVTYVYTSAEGLDIFKDVNGNLWYFGQGYYPYAYWGTNAGSYWKSGVANRVFRYAYVANGHNIYTDDYGNMWWFENNAAHLYSKGKGSNPQPTPSGDVDYTHVNTMSANGQTSTVFVGQYWTAPTYASWVPDGMRLLGWDYAESTGYVRWKPGQSIKNTGHDLTLYPVYG